MSAALECTDGTRAQFELLAPVVQGDGTAIAHVRWSEGKTSRLFDFHRPDVFRALESALSTFYDVLESWVAEKRDVVTCNGQPVSNYVRFCAGDH